MSCETPNESTSHGGPNESDNPPHSGTDTGLLVSLLSSMKEGINQTNSLLADFMSKAKPGKDTRKRTLDSEHSGSDSEPSKPENIREKLPQTRSAPKRARYSTQEGHSQTTKIVQDVIETPLVETSGPGQPDKSQGLGDDLVSLFAGDDFNLSDEDTMDNTSLLTDIDSALSSSTEKGPPVSPHLAKIIDQRLSSEIDREKLKCIVSKYKTPQNCEQLYLTKINQEIWSQLPAHAKRADIRVANLQDTLLGGISATLVSVNELLECREKKTLPDYKGLITNLVDSIALTGLVCKELSYKRRETLRPLLRQDFQQACSRSNKIGKLLFGDDLPKTIQDLKSTNKVMNSVAKPVNTYSKSHSKPKSYSHASTSNDKSFLWVKGRTQYPPKKFFPQSQSQFNKKKFTKH